VGASPSIKWPQSLSLTVYKLLHCLWTCRSLSAGLKLHYCCLSDINLVSDHFSRLKRSLAHLSNPLHPITVHHILEAGTIPLLPCCSITAVTPLSLFYHHCSIPGLFLTTVVGWREVNIIINCIPSPSETLFFPPTPCLKVCRTSPCGD